MLYELEDVKVNDSLGMLECILIFHMKIFYVLC